MRHFCQIPMVTRRQTLQFAVAAAAGGFVGIEADAQGRAVINPQLGWLLSGNQLGEPCAKQLGDYEQEGIDLRFQPWGPATAMVAVGASSRYDIRPASSCASLMGSASRH